MNEHEALVMILQNQIGMAYGEAAANRAALLVAQSRNEQLEKQVHEHICPPTQPPAEEPNPTEGEH